MIDHNRYMSLRPVQHAQHSRTKLYRSVEQVVLAVLNVHLGTRLHPRGDLVISAARVDMYAREHSFECNTASVWRGHRLCRVNSCPQPRDPTLEAVPGAIVHIDLSLARFELGGRLEAATALPRNLEQREMLAAAIVEHMYAPMTPGGAS